MKKIVVTGPESTGKTTLAQQLGEYYQTIWVREFAREYLSQLNRDYQESDLLKIAQGQVQKENETAVQANQWLICDTSLEVIKVWSEVKYGRCHPWILKQLRQRTADLYLLTAPDIPWAPDPQREHPAQREALYQIYVRELEDKPYIEIWGNREKRLNTAINKINSLI